MLYLIAPCSILSIAHANFARHSALGLLGLTLILSLIGCSGQTPQASPFVSPSSQIHPTYEALEQLTGQPTPTSAPLLFPQLSPTAFLDQKHGQGWVAPLGRICGTLVVENDCLRLTRGPSSNHLIIWPPWVTLDVRQGRLEILDLEGRVLAEAGEEICLSGGESTSHDFVITLLRSDQELPEACRGPYWLVGHEIGSVPPK